MPELGSDAAGSSRMRRVAPNTLDPEMMRAKERLQELARILADGYQRGCLIRGQKRATGSEKLLDSLGDQSDGCVGG